MKSDELRRAIGEIDDDLILNADGARDEGSAALPLPKKRVLKRRPIVIAAAALLLTAITVTLAAVWLRRPEEPLDEYPYDYRWDADDLGDDFGFDGYMTGSPNAMTVILSVPLSMEEAADACTAKKVGFSLMPDGESYAFCGPEIGYKAETYEIPSVYEGKPVTVIDKYAFFGCEINKIVIPEGVVEIRAGAFCMSGTPEILLPESIREISPYAIPLSMCSRNGFVSFGDLYQPTYLGTKDNPHYFLYHPDPADPTAGIHEDTRVIGGVSPNFTGDVKYERIYIPANVVHISSGVFGYSKNFKEIVLDERNEHYSLTDGCLIEKETSKLIIAQPGASLPQRAGIRVICSGAFRGRVPEGRIDIPKGVTVIEDSAFMDRSADAEVRLSLPEGLVSIGRYAFAGLKIEKVILPSSVKRVGDYAFSDCKAETISVPDGILYFGESVFGYNSQTYQTKEKDGVQYLGNKKHPYLIAVGANKEIAGTLVLPKTLRFICRTTFKECRSLTGIVLPEGLLEIGEEAFECCSIGEVVIPEGVRTIGVRAFRSAGVKSVRLKGGTTSISSEAFRHNGMLTSVTIGEGTQSIGHRAFADCAIEELHLPESLVSISREAFRGNCFRTVTISKNVTSIGVMAFTATAWSANYKCNLSTLEKITVDKENLYYKSEGNCLIRISNGMIIQGCSGSVIPDDGSIRGIGEGAFMCCVESGDLRLPEGLQSIGNSAFSGCIGLNSVTLPKSLQTVGNYAFYGTPITSIVLPEGLTRIGDKAFACTELTEVTVPGSVKEIVTEAFGESKLRRVILCEGVETIGQSAFTYCYDLTEVQLPEGLVRIETDAFYCCPLTEIVIPESVSFIAAQTFDAENLEKIAVEEGNEYFFAEGNCLIERESGRLVLAGIGSVLPTDGSIKSIGRGAFTGRKDLTDLVIPDGVTVIKDAFSYCENLQSVVIPRSVTELSDYAFCFIIDSGEKKKLVLLYRGSEPEWQRIVLKQYAVRDVKEIVYNYNE